MNDAMPQGNGTKTVEYRPYRQIVGETDISFIEINMRKEIEKI